MEYIILNHENFGNCSPEGSDYDCFFVPCDNEIALVSNGPIIINTRLRNQEHDCDCNLDTFVTNTLFLQ